jgi:glycosyltransferase 2 family protein
MPSPPSTAAPRRPLYKRPLVWIGFGLSGLAVATFVSLFDVGRVYRSLLLVSWWAFPTAGVVFLTSYLVRSLRWKLLLTPLARLPYGLVRDVLLTGFMVNNLLPARAGELARALVLGRVAGTSRRAALASIGVERIFDGITLIAILSLLGFAFDVPPWTRQLGRITTVIIMGLTALLVWLAYHDRSFFKFFNLFLFFMSNRIREKILNFFRRFVDGTRALKDPRLVLAVALLSPLIWGLEFGVYYLMLRGFAVPLPGWAAALAVVVTNFGIAVPSAPGYVGIFEAACSGALIGLGLDKELAVSYAIGVHLLLFACISTTGLLLMWRLGLKLSDVTRTDEASEEPPSPSPGPSG